MQRKTHPVGKHHIHTFDDLRELCESQGFTPSPPITGKTFIRVESLERMNDRKPSPPKFSAYLGLNDQTLTVTRNDK